MSGVGDALTNPLLGTPPAGDQPDLLGSGIVSGPGNQGSATQAHMAGQAGTGGTFLSLPRQLKIGVSGAKPQ